MALRSVPKPLPSSGFAVSVFDDRRWPDSVPQGKVWWRARLEHLAFWSWYGAAEEDVVLLPEPAPRSREGSLLAFGCVLDDADEACPSRRGAWLWCARDPPRRLRREGAEGPRARELLLSVGRLCGWLWRCDDAGGFPFLATADQVRTATESESWRAG